MQTTPSAPNSWHATECTPDIEPSVTTILPSTPAASISTREPPPTHTSGAVRSQLVLPLASIARRSWKEASLLRPGATSHSSPTSPSHTCPPGKRTISACGRP